MEDGAVLQRVRNVPFRESHQMSILRDRRASPILRLFDVAEYAVSAQNRRELLLSAPPLKDAGQKVPLSFQNVPCLRGNQWI